MIGQIALFAGNQTPRGWKRCDGAALSSTHFRALYELIGNTYGGNTSSFNLPNLGGRYMIQVEGDRANLRPDEWEFLPAPGDDAPMQYVQSLTYEELFDLLDNEDLTPGKQYLITDFAARWFMLNLTTPIAASEQTGVTEPLLVTALTSSTLLKQCRSALYPTDILEYNPLPGEYIANPGGGDYMYDSFYADFATIISGFKGVISRRIDTVDNVDAPFDWRNLTFRRWAVNPAAWSNATAYSVNNAVQDGNILYVCIQANTNKTPASEPTYWQPLLSANLSTDPYWSNSSTNFYFTRGGSSLFCPVTSSYQDYKAFGGYKVKNVKIYSSTLSALNSVWKQTADYQSHSFTIGYDSYLNTIGARFVGNEIGIEFQVNHIGTDFSYCRIGCQFLWNFLLNTFQYNTTHGSFKYNWIAGSCTDNVFARNFESNDAKSGFASNEVGYNFKTNDYTGATLVYNSYRKTLSKSPDGTKWLTYISNAGAVTIVSHTT
ncbi:MAG: tail fiber protein [Bacteroidetes bacterium]|nr:tail fiber protein [Bacteroidota bacterium]